jgi:hypothetical protein
MSDEGMQALRDELDAKESIEEGTMNPNILRIVGTLVAVALGVLGHAGVVPVSNEVSSSIATLLIGWLHLEKPKS